MFYSPLRYPGGKNKLAKFIGDICELNGSRGHYIEPYAGGASVALYLLLKGKVKQITINDFDRAIYAFWHSIIHDTERFCSQIMLTEVNLNTWKRQKEIHNNKNTIDDLFRLGFATFFLNRTNRSGIIDGGPIGGKDQSGTYKIDCRFNKKDLIERIQLIASKRKNIRILNLDAMSLIDLVEKEGEERNCIFYFDPPYYLKGPSLYMSHYQHEDHESVGKRISKIKHAQWIVSYDNTLEIKEIYSNFAIQEYSFFHTAYKVREGREVLFYSPGLVVPNIASPTNYK